jgi:hypothetical protein
MIALLCSFFMQALDRVEGEVHALNDSWKK